MTAFGLFPGFNFFDIRVALPRRPCLGPSLVSIGVSGGNFSERRPIYFKKSNKKEQKCLLKFFLKLPIVWSGNAECVRRPKIDN